MYAFGRTYKNGGELEPDQNSQITTFDSDRMGFFSTYFKSFYSPAQAFELLLQHTSPLRTSFLYLLIPITGYTLMYVFLTIAHGAPSVFTPWLNIPKEEYYSVNRFLLAPSMILCWWSASALMHLTARMVGGKGNFEGQLAIVALSISVAMWGGLLHDLPMSFLSAIGVIDARQHEIDMNSPTPWRTILWVCYSLYLIAFLILFSKAVQVVQKLSGITSGVIGTLGFILFQLVFLIFNR